MKEIIYQVTTDYLEKTTLTLKYINILSTFKYNRPLTRDVTVPVTYASGQILNQNFVN